MKSSGRTGKIDWSLVAFIVSLCGIAFAYGIATMRLHWFPYDQLLRARMAYDAMMQLRDSEFEFNTTKMDDKAKPGRQIARLSPAAGSELLLVTGGPNQDAQHCPEFGCLAWIIDRQGKVLHSWPLKLNELFADAKGFYGAKNVSHFYPVGLHLLDDGSLIAIFQGFHRFPYAAGIVRVGWDGKILWKHLDHAHHWFKVAPDGTIYAPAFAGTKMDYFGSTAIKSRCKAPIYNEGVAIYGRDGVVKKTIHLVDALIKSGFPGLLYGLQDGCDPIHVNSVDLVRSEVAHRIPGAAGGDLLLSLRESSSLVLLDPASAKVKKVFAGHTVAQHSAHILPDGTVAVFDNLGGDRALGGSRIVRIDLATDETQTIYPHKGDPLLPFTSSNGGHISISPDGKRIIASSKDQARAIEIDIATGKPLWTMTEVLDIAPFLKPRPEAGKQVAAWFKLWGTYYIPPEQAKGLPL